MDTDKTKEQDPKAEEEKKDDSSADKKEEEKKEPSIEELFKSNLEEYQKSIDDKINNLINVQNNIKTENEKLQKEKRELEIKDELNKAGLNSDFYEFVFSQDVEVTTKRIELLKSYMQENLEKIVAEWMRKHSYVPPGSSVGHGNSTDEIKKPRYMV